MGQPRPKQTVVKISDESFITLHNRWAEQAMTSIFVAVVNDKINQLPPTKKNEYVQCSKSVDSVIAHAKCISNQLQLANSSIIHSSTAPIDSNHRPWIITRRLNKYKSISSKNFKRREDFKVLKRARRHTHEYNHRTWTKRQVANVKQVNQISSKYEGLGPLGMVAKLLTGVANIVKSDKNEEKTDTIPWEATIEMIRQANEKRKSKRSGRGISSHSHSERVLPSPLKRFMQDAVKLGMALAGRNSKKEGVQKPVKWLSPRFLSLVPDDDDDEGSGSETLLSPSVLSMHNDGNGLERNTSLPALLKDFSAKDRDQWMNFIMTATGIDKKAAEFLRKAESASDVVQIEDTGSEMDANNLMENLKSLPESMSTSLTGNAQNDINWEVVDDKYYTKKDQELIKRRNATWERLVDSYTESQIQELDTKGISVLSKDQLKLLYGARSPFKDLRTLVRLIKMTPRQIYRTIESDIHKVAKMDRIDLPLPPMKPKMGRRYKRQARPGIVNLILSPVLLSSGRINSPLIFGPVILSPRVFAPVILSAIGFAPVILSPGVFVPVILSPYLARPNILSPGLFNPAIISPLNMSPAILSPQVFSPNILSPLLFGPIILNPILGSPLILSPRLLSPVILSHRFLYALILAPYALTPSILSPKPDEIRILSPSWLS
ncbi:moulting cycle domain-containing protein [Ditylenchus destructor]|nr:moulting cycle domain-containing protein [Ditylenchus destructor]